MFRELEARDELVANLLLEMTWFRTSELWLEPAGGKRTRVVLEHGRVVIGVAVLDEYGDAAVLRALAVRATCRRQEHGRALVEHIVGRKQGSEYSFQVSVDEQGNCTLTPVLSPRTPFVGGCSDALAVDGLIPA